MATKENAMFRVAIIEDDERAAEILKGYLSQYQKEHNINIQCVVHHNPITFFISNDFTFDIIFMDIDMPDMDGLTAAKKLRQIDENTILIFVTNLGHYAIKGYEVRAFDFIVKPVSYSSFKMRMQKAMYVIEKKSEKYVVISLPYGMMRVAISDIYYIEILGHVLTFFTTKGKIEGRGTISDYETLLESYGFLRCSKSVIVNARYVEQIKEEAVFVNNSEIQISRRRKKSFAEAVENIVQGKIFSRNETDQSAK